MKLLLIEDDKPSLKALYSTLTILGFNCEGFSDPLEAMKRIHANQDFDAVLTDLRMPDLSGAEVLDQLHQHFPGTPGILITAYRDHKPTRADKIFYKPVDINSLVNYLNILDSGHGLADSTVTDSKQDPDLR